MPDAAPAAAPEAEHHSPDFVHLHVHTDYSLLDGCSHIGRLLERAVSMKMSAVAITDHGNLYGLFDFWNDASKKYKIKPLLGCELYLLYEGKLTERTKAKRYHMGVLAKNFKGYQNLTKLVSDAHTLGFYTRPRTDMEQLAKYAEGLIGFTGCMQGVVPQLILAGEMDKAREALGRFVEIFGKENYFVEIMDHGMPEQLQLIPPLLKLAEEFGLKVVATNDVHYVDACHHAAHDAMVCIQTGAKIADEKRMKYPSRQFYLKSQAEMMRLFSERPDALTNTVAVAEMCEVKLPVTSGAENYPVYRLATEVTVEPRAKFDEILDAYVALKNSLNTAAGKAADFTLPEAKRATWRKNGSYLLNLCIKGLIERYGVDYDDPASWADDAPRPQGQASPAELCRRIDYELSIIAGTGFIDYFLIVWDFINWAREHGVSVGPGRGSGAGSLVAYILKITDIDPIRFSLLFERFLNPERVSAPDFDIDFCMRRRDEVVVYVREKYGADRVANIITYGTLGAKMVIRDLARVHDVPFAESNRLAKLIPDELDITLAKAMKDSPDLREEINRNPMAAEIMKEGEVIEGMVRNTGKHACGMIIADRPLTDLVPVTLQEGALTTQYSKDPVDKLGLLKMDFLGLKTLTVIDDAVQFVRRKKGFEKFDIEKVPLEDAPTFKLLNSGRTIAVFQLESEGMQALCRQFSIATIDEIIALIALYRPGPMQFIPQYIAGKKDPGTIKYAHPLMIPIAKETYGILVYQEQVMEVAKVVGGYTLGGADMLRRAMGKKIAEEMARQKSIFVEGAGKTNGIDPAKAGEIFDVLAKFAEYGFNKSHSAAYGFLSYRTAYLKANHPVEFMAAVLRNEIGNSEKLAFMVGECEEMDIRVLGPDVNISGEIFTPVPADNAIRFGLGAVKGVGEGAAAAIVAERTASGPFKNFVDFMERMPDNALNSRVLECLIKSGAFDFAGDDRRHLLDSIEGVKRHAADRRADKAGGQGNLFDLLGGDEAADSGFGAENLINRKAPPMSDAEKLQYEKELLGFYLSGHPLDAYAGLDAAASTLAGPVSEFKGSRHDRWPLRFCGIVTGLKKMFTKEKIKEKKDGTKETIPPAPWAAFTLGTRELNYEVNVFPEAYESVQDMKHLDGAPLLAEGSHVIVDAEISWRPDREQWSIQAFRLHSLQGALPGLMRSVLFIVRPNADGEAFLAELAAYLHSEKGTGRTRIRLGLRQPDGRVLQADTASALSGHLSPEILKKLTKHAGCAGILLESAPPAEKPKREWGGRK